MSSQFHPLEAMATMKHEFGEHGGVNMSIEASTTFSVMQASTLPDIFQGRQGPEGGCYLYGRHFNPTVYTLGKQIAWMEGAEAGYCTASGMAAISAVLMQLCNRGDEIIASQTLYGGTFALMHDYLPLKTGVTTRFVDVSDLRAVEAAITTKTRVLYVETLSNPMLAVADIPKLSAIAKKHKISLVVDNTFSPLVVSPIRLGADIVVHSITKFINGSSDIIAGAICGKTEFVSTLMDLHTGSLMLLGPTMDPKTAAEISLRLPHLGLRMVEHSRRALLFSERLCEMGVDVIYPGLKDHPGRTLLDKFGNSEFGYGGVMCIDLETSVRACEFMERLQNEERFGFMAVSLGFFDTLMTCPASTTSSEMSDEDLLKSGIRPGLVRLSLGYTGTLEQRWAQLKNVVNKMNLV